LFQKFTEKAIIAVKESQIAAIELGHKKIYPEHLLWVFSKRNSELGAKILKMNNISPDDIKAAIVEKLKDKELSSPAVSVAFSDKIKKVFIKASELTKLSGTSFVRPEHLFYALLFEKISGLDKVFEMLNFNSKKTFDMMKQILEKKSKHREKHPEGFEQKENDDKYNHILSLVKDPEASSVFSRAVAKLTTSEYEILGTEQIMLSILEDTDGDLAEILKKSGITLENFSEKLKQVKSRLAEYEDKQIIFTPNALVSLVWASETARELGSTSVLPEHIVLGILKAKKGIAYNILQELNTNLELSEQILRPLEKQMNETPVILRFAKQEARRLGKNTVGTELILIGIMLQGSGVGYSVLKDLGITVADMRNETEKLLGVVDDYNEKEITFTPRAKSVLELAWKFAKKERKTKIYSEHLLRAIVEHPDSLASKVLAHLGADALEIKQGIQNKISAK